MKIIETLVDSYTARKESLVLEKLSPSKLLKVKIKTAKLYLEKIRLEIRMKKFKSKESEIYFFKHVKPRICAELKFFSFELSYQVEKPNSTVCRQVAHIKSELKKLENKKRKNIAFYSYYKHAESFWDDKYFLRGSGQFTLFSSEDVLCADPEFNTSHDMLAAEVILYDLLTEFYKNELVRLKIQDKDCPNLTTGTKTSDSKIQWTASKRDLIELVYAFKFSGVINNGNTNIKEMIQVFGNLFDIDLGNYYKTYSEIKNRSTNQAKFLNRLTDNLIIEIEKEYNMD